jgi:hypothetical protein
MVRHHRGDAVSSRKGGEDKKRERDGGSSPKGKSASDGIGSHGFRKRQASSQGIHLIGPGMFPPPFF